MEDWSSDVWIRIGGNGDAAADEDDLIHDEEAE